MLFQVMKLQLKTVTKQLKTQIKIRTFIRAQLGFFCMCVYVFIFVAIIWWLLLRNMRRQFGSIRFQFGNRNRNIKYLIVSLFSYFLRFGTSVDLACIVTYRHCYCVLIMNWTQRWNFVLWFMFAVNCCEAISDQCSRFIPPENFYSFQKVKNGNVFQNRVNVIH